MAWLQQFFTDPVGMAAQAVLVVALLDFVLGVSAAIRDKIFTLDEIAAFLRTQIMGRVVPITAMLFIGYFGSQPLITALGLASAAAYVAETIGSLAQKWGPHRTLQPVPTA